MAISPINSSTSAADLRTQFQQQRSDLQSLSASLQSGNLDAAQTAFAQWQKDQQALSNAQGTNAQKPATNSAISADVQALGAALKSGNIGDAQKAFAQLKTLCSGG